MTRQTIRTHVRWHPRGPLLCGKPIRQARRDGEQTTTYSVAEVTCPDCARHPVVRDAWSQLKEGTSRASRLWRGDHTALHLTHGDDR